MSSFGRATNSKPAFLREAYRRLTGDCSASDTLDQVKVDERVAELLEHEDIDTWDLRVNNQGRPEQFDIFWSTVSNILIARLILPWMIAGMIVYMRVMLSLT